MILVMIIITIEGLTITNCGHPNDGVFQFTNIGNFSFLQNSIQFMSGYGLMASNCVSVVLSNCSFYHSVVCLKSGSGVAIYYGRSPHKKYSLELTFSSVVIRNQVEAFNCTPALFLIFQ